MDCKDVERLLSAKPLAALAPARQEGVAKHLTDCEACRARWDLAPSARKSSTTR